MNLVAIESESQYQQCLDRISTFINIDPSPDTHEGRLLDELTKIVEDYERKMGWELPEKC